jgi:hypothetical protein
MRRAIAGEKAPFRLILTGQPQKYNDSDLAYAVQKKHKDRRTGETLETLENCFPSIADEFGVSESRVRGAYAQQGKEAGKIWEIYQARNKRNSLV